MLLSFLAISCRFCRILVVVGREAMLVLNGPWKGHVIETDEQFCFIDPFNDITLILYLNYNLTYIIYALVILLLM